MKYFIMLLALVPMAASAQVYTAAGAASQSASGSISGSTSVSAPTAAAAGGTGIGSLGINASPSTVITSTGSDLGKAVPFTAAPQMTVLGGEDSCLKSRSGGGAISGFGASFGTMVMDNECNRRVLSKTLNTYGHPELAVAVLCGSPQMWAAAARVAAWKSRKTRSTMLSVCHNAKPGSADDISATIVDEQVAAGPVDTADDHKWSFSSREDSGFVY